MFNKILVANRGEIAIRIIRACREMGIKTAVVYSEAERNSLPVRMADEAYCIGPPPAVKSYLNLTNIISAAIMAGADAVHPGYGFLSENPDFAEICNSHGLTFIGPPSDVIEKAGNKFVTRALMAAENIPVVPGSAHVLGDSQNIMNEAEKIGYPVLIKAVSGGGGRGIRVVRGPGEIAESVQLARSESMAAFNDPQLYMEKYIVNARHIEFQILGDKYGNIVHLGERDCSIQRRNQKLIEESPSIALSPELRNEMGKMAVKAAQAIGYSSAGTVEFLLDKDNRFYFIEMNTRIQVEHPVTEMVTGVDLVKEQIRLAAGEALGRSQKDINLNGWAIECRINAEDAENNFAPTAGRVINYLPPGGPGIRIDGAAWTGWSVTPFYDSLLCKLISWGQNREEAIARMERALSEFIIAGVPTTIVFHKRIMASASFRSGEILTNFVDTSGCTGISSKV